MQTNGWTRETRKQQTAKEHRAGNQQGSTIVQSVSDVKLSADIIRQGHACPDDRLRKIRTCQTRPVIFLVA